MADTQGNNVGKLGEDLSWVERINTGFGEIMLTMRVCSESERGVGAGGSEGIENQHKNKIKPVGQFPGWRKAEPEKSSYILVFIGRDNSLCPRLFDLSYLPEERT